MLVTSIRQLFPQQAVMLNVVGTGQLPPAEGHLNGQEDQHEWAKKRQQSGIKQSSQKHRLKHFVPQAPDTFSTPAEALLLQSPCPLESTGNLTQ